MRLPKTWCWPAIVTAGITLAARADAQWQQPQPQPQLQPPPPFQQPPPLQQQPPPPPPMGWQPPPPAPPPSDEGRGLEWFWARAEVGASYMHLSLDDALGLSAAGAKASSGGLVLGAAAGVRLLFFTLGARFRFHQLADYNLWQLGGMLGAHFPSGSWDFGGDLYFGYASVGSFHADMPPSAPSGVHFGVEGGADYFLLKWFSLGATIDFELLFLGRAGKSSVGLGTALVPHAALHF